MKLMTYCDYGSASVPNWPQKQSQNIYFLKFPGGAHPQNPLVLHACLLLHAYIHIRHPCNPPSKDPVCYRPELDIS